jgi:hydrogenase expression/formation protein HypE
MTDGERVGDGSAGSSTSAGERILLGHGSGGKLYRDLVKDVFVKAFANPVLERLDDAAALAPEGRIALTTDSHVVQPLRFAGGDIGRLSVAGTVNDLATAAARPLALAAAFIIEEGFPLADLRDLCASAAATASEAGVPIVTGDTKVVERGAADGLFITTTGVGEIVVAHELGCAAVRPGDAVILSGSIGDHAVAILAARGQFTFSADVRSDCAPLWGLVEAAVAAAREAGASGADPAAGAGGAEALHFLRDPTRGGLTTVLAELAEEAGLGIEVEEAAIPVSPAVRSVCDLLGYDPLTLANEGKMVLVVAPQAADAVVAAIQKTQYGRDARRIGFVTAAHPGRVALRTPFGTRRVLDMPIGELLPRIC